MAPEGALPLGLLSACLGLSGAFKGIHKGSLKRATRVLLGFWGVGWFRVLGFGGFGFKGLGFGVLGFRGLGFSGWGLTVSCYSH